MTDTAFSASEWLRYTRHLQLPQIGVAGQQHLKQSRVLIVGAGGLGSPVSLYLAAAGVGRITIVDADTIDLTNLQRQVVFTAEQVGFGKADCTRQRLLAMNPDIHVEAIEEALSIDNADALIGSVDLVLDCTDNFPTRYIINDTCVKLKKSWIFASIHQFSGQCALFTPDSACFRCLFPEAPTNAPDCNAAGVLGVLPGLLGTLQANEAIKYLANLSPTLENQLALVEAMDVSISKIQLTKNPACTVCGESKAKPAMPDQSVEQCAAGLSHDIEITAEAFLHLRNDASVLLLDVRNDDERIAFHLGGMHLPLATIEQKNIELEKQKAIVCYCQTGVRSRKAAEILLSLGYTSSSLRGGIVNFLKHYLTTL